MPPPSQLERSGAHVLEFALKLDYFTEANWHRLWERRPLRFTVMATLAEPHATAASVTTDASRRFMPLMRITPFAADR